ncbi:MAG: CHAT domain-containing protein [Pseudomonadota bacterium]
MTGSSKPSAIPRFKITLREVVFEIRRATLSARDFAQIGNWDQVEEEIQEALILREKFFEDYEITIQAFQEIIQADQEAHALLILAYFHKRNMPALLDLMEKSRARCLANRFDFPPIDPNAQRMAESQFVRGPKSYIKPSGVDAAVPETSNEKTNSPFRRVILTGKVAYTQFVRAAPQGGALVMMSTSNFGTVVVVVPRWAEETDQFHSLLLSEMTSDKIWDAILRLNLARLRAEATQNEYKRNAFRELESVTAGICRWLWAGLMGPLNSTLKRLLAARKADDPVREVVLLPSGLLGLLPLHAAQDRQKRTFIDRWIVSYAPSVGKLVDCESARVNQDDSNKKPGNRHRRLFAVSDPRENGNEEHRLHFARKEHLVLNRFFHSGKSLFLRQDASLETLQSILKNCAAAESEEVFLHFGTHGVFDWYDPANSCLFLADEDLLTLRDLQCLAEDKALAGGVERNNHLARLVFLSACESGLFGTQLPEEFIGFPSAFVQAGAAGVVGSLWKVQDSYAYLMGRCFYYYYFEEGMSPAAALRESVLWLKDASFADLKKICPPPVEVYDKPCLDLSRRPEEPDPDPGMSDYDRSKSRPLLALRADRHRPYEDHRHWAAFTMTGV